jgi:hypothetical protein
MCDYSLMVLPNRLAKESEILVTHQFSTGSIGFVSPEELCNAEPPAPCVPVGIWGAFKAWFTGRPALSTVPAVCLPPGAQLRLLSIPERMRKTLGAEPEEELAFTQVTAASNQFRDALRIKGNREILLQNVGEGLEVQVVRLTLAAESQPHEEHGLIQRR